MKKNLLNQAFFARPVVTVAEALLGAVLEWDGASGIIVETEAYSSHGDEACHTMTRQRARDFFKEHPPGSAYVYLNYGIHCLLNFSTQHREERGFVLVRALKPNFGIELMEHRRGTKKMEALCSGPGKLCQALGIQLNANGARLEDSKFQLYKSHDHHPIGITYADRRIGITKSVELPWRFLMDSPFVSRAPSVTARRAITASAQKKPTE